MSTEVAAAPSAPAGEKTAEELRREIQELQRQHREISDRLRDPRGLRRGAPGGVGGASRPARGLVRPAAESEDQPETKRRLLSAVVKVDGGNVKDEVDKGEEKDRKEELPFRQDVAGAGRGGDVRNARAGNIQSNGGFRRDGPSRTWKLDYGIPQGDPLPRVFPKNEDPSLVKRNQRMLGQLLGTLEKFKEEDKKLSNTEAYMRRSDSLRRAEEKARDESVKLKQQEWEQIAEKRKRDLILRARVAAKAEQKRLELSFIHWSEHHKMLSNYTRTKAEPVIYYKTAKPLVDDPSIVEMTKEQAFLEWKSARRAELSEFQKQVEEQYLTNVEKQLERWQNSRKSRDPVNLQETMDKELDTHRLEHGPKPRRIPGGNEDDEDVEEDMAAEDELMDEVLDVGERGTEGDATKLSEVRHENSSLAQLQME